jgi:non-canonical purine NTP pyrophosphatase (RdgB/HAM1 family)
MKQFTFISGNPDKVRYLERFLGHPVAHQSIDLDEVQSNDIRYVTKKKAEAAFAIVQTPVLVEDVSLEFDAWNGLPGTFIRFFMKGMGIEGLCKVLGAEQRGVNARCVYDYFDGTDHVQFEGSMRGSIPDTPRGDTGMGWDCMFIPEGYTETRAEMSEEDNMKTYIRIKPLVAVKDFLFAE